MIVLDIDYHEGVHYHRSSNGCLFEAKWLKEETVSEKLTTTWNRAKLAGLGLSLAHRTRAVKADLHSWTKMFTKVRKNIKNLKEN
jgi:hypothetical protein